jgi:hypothetical protein
VRRKQPALKVSLLALNGVAVAAFLGGCSSSEPGDPSAGATTATSPTTGSDPTANTSRTATPTATSTARIDANQLAAAAAVTQIHIMYAEYNVMLTSGSSERFRQTFARACKPCVQEAAGIERIQDRGQRVEGGIFTLSRLRATAIHREVVVVEGILSETPSRVTSGNRVVARFPGMKPTKMSWTVSKATGTWLVSRAEPVR